MTHKHKKSTEKAVYHVGDRPRVELAYGETGHSKIVRVKPLTIEIQNIPMGGKWNLKDIVLAKPIRGYNGWWVKPTKLVKRTFAMRTGLSYSKIKQFYAFVKHMKKLGGECEGFVAPSKGGSGMLACSHKPDLDIDSIAAKHGMKIEEHMLQKPKRRSSKIIAAAFSAAK